MIGGSDFRDYPRLRDALDFALADRLRDVEILTTGGPGVPALSASYARSRGLPFRPIPPDFEIDPGNAIEKWDEVLLTEADALIIAGDELDLPTVEWMKRARRKEIPVMMVGSDWGKTIIEPAVVPRPCGLPD